MTADTQDGAPARPRGLGGFPPSWHKKRAAAVAEAPTRAGGSAHRVPVLPDPPHGRALILAVLLDDLADARAYATIVYADAWLSAEGIAEARTQTAKLAAAAATLAADRARAAVDAYRLMLPPEAPGVL
jgi:hypothetical protein